MQVSSEQLLIAGTAAQLLWPGTFSGSLFQLSLVRSVSGECTRWTELSTELAQ
jgi:hypothetical protein